MWVGTVAGSSITGRCENGYTVFASGNDENGNPVSNYALGKGLVEILEADTELKPGADIKYVRIFDEAPDQLKAGDMWPDGAGGYIIYQNGSSHGLAENAMSFARELQSTVEDNFQSVWVDIADIQNKIPLQASPSN